MAQKVICAEFFIHKEKEKKYLKDTEKATEG